MKHYILTLLLGLCLSLPLMAQSNEATEDADAKWLSEVYHEHLDGRRDLREHMSPGMRLKLGRMKQMLDFDPIIYSLGNYFAGLDVQPLAEKGYYSVRRKNSRYSGTTVRLEGRQIQSLCPWKVTPKELKQKLPEAKVNMSSARSFLTTFLHQYLNTYIRASNT